MNKCQNALYYLYDIFRNHKDEINEADDINVKKVKHCFDTLEKLVDKATPKKPIKHFNSFYRCENCGELFQNHHYQNNCPNCGQALDWSDKDES